MNIKRFRQRLDELAAMSPEGEETTVLIQQSDDHGGVVHVICCPQLVEVKDWSMIEGEVFVDGDNDDLTKDLQHAISIRSDSTFG